MSQTSLEELMAATADLAVAVDKLLERLDRLEQKVDHLTDALGAVTTFSSKTNLLAEAAGDTAAHFWSEAEAKGIDPIARGFAGMELAERLSDPEQIALVNRLLDQTATVKLALAAADSVDPADLETVITKGASTVGILAEVLSSPEFSELLKSAPLTLDVAAKTTTALVAAKTNVQPVGPFGALMKMGDKDVQKAVGFSLALAKAFGAKL